MVNDLSYRPWEASVAAIAALLKELSSPPSLRVEVIAMPPIKTVTSHPQSATSESKSEPQLSTPQSTHAQTEMWVNDPSIPPKWREIRRFVVKEYGDDWKGITTPTIIKAAEGSPEFKRRVRPFPATVTWNRALRRKRDRRRHRERH
jgi:hypothetical protein